MDSANMADVVCLEMHSYYTLASLKTVETSFIKFSIYYQVHEFIWSHKLTQCPGWQHLQVGFVALDGVHVHEVNHEFG